MLNTGLKITEITNSSSFEYVFGNERMFKRSRSLKLIITIIIIIIIIVIISVKVQLVISVCVGISM